MKAKGAARHEPQRAAINPATERLGVLVGEWNMEAMAPTHPPAAVSGRASFTWLESGAFLRMNSRGDQANFPTAISIIGSDDSRGTYTMLYSDSRGVTRVYEMSLNGGVWKLWRDDPGFSQRFTGNLSEDGNTITARWEKSTDGKNWEHDFDLTYSRIRSAVKAGKP